MARKSVRVDPATVERLRMERGYADQESLARAAGVDQTTVSRMERLPGPYQLATVEKVARALGVAVDALRAGEAEAGPGAGAALLRAFLGALGRPVSNAEKRKLARDLSSAARLLAEDAGDGTFKSEKRSRTAVQKNRRPPTVRQLSSA